MDILTTGIVLKTTDVGEYDKIITVLTEYGRLSFRAFGIRLMKNVNASACMEFALSEFELTVKDGMARLKRSRLIQTMIRPGKSLSVLSLAFYIAEVCLYASVEFPLSKDESRIHDDGLFALAANALFILAKEDRDILLVKAVFELRAMSVLGYAPDIPNCSVCGENCTNSEHYTSLHLINGNLKCSSCCAESFSEMTGAPNNGKNGLIVADAFEENTVMLSRDALLLAERTLTCPEKSAYAVSIPEKLMKEFGSFTEKYLLCQLEKNFRSLTYFKDIYGYESNI